MFSPNGSDPGGVKTVLLVFVLAMLAHLCAVQMAHGAETFLPADPSARGGATLQVRPDATIVGEEIRVRQVARWATPDKTTLDPIGDLVVARFDKGSAFRDVAVGDVKRFLGDAGVNLAAINVVGPTVCRVTRSDAECPPGVAVEQAIAAETGQTAPAAAETPNGPYRTLRQLLVADAAGRLNLGEDKVQVTFRPTDDAVLRLTEPHATFVFVPVRNNVLGATAWDVAVGGKKHLTVAAVVKIWQTQLVLNRPVQTREAVTAADVTETRQLVDRLDGDTPLTIDQLAGQAVVRAMPAGSVVTDRTVTPVELVRTGQDVTIDTLAGGISLKTVARALESGSLGQKVRLRNEQTREAFDAVVTGPQTVSLAAAMTLHRTVR